MRALVIVLAVASLIGGVTVETSRAAVATPCCCSRIILLADEFDRPDGPLGAAPTGQAWTFTGGGAGAIVAGRYEATIAPTYANAVLAETPTRIYGRASWSGTETNSAAVLLASRGGARLGGGGAFANMVHVVFTRAHAIVGVYENGVPTTLTVMNYPDVAFDGIPHDVSIEVDGSTATILLPNGAVGSVTDPRIGLLWGPQLIVQIYNDGVIPAPVRWDSIGAERN